MATLLSSDPAQGGVDLPRRNPAALFVELEEFLKVLVTDEEFSLQPMVKRFTVCVTYYFH